MGYYNKRKEMLRDEAMDFIRSFNEEKTWSYDGLYDAQQYFEKMGKRYGLLEEFRENGII